MKIEVVNTVYISNKQKSENDLYALDIKLIDEDKFKIGDTFISEDDKKIIFKVKSIAIGSYDFIKDILSIQIEPLSFPIETFKGKKFIKE